jgi:hypothetical protein
MDEEEGINDIVGRFDGRELTDGWAVSVGETVGLGSVGETVLFKELSR